MVISFSGLDGAGKSTLIGDLSAHFEAEGRSVVVLTMYDNLTLFSRLRVARDAVKRAIRAALGRSEPAPPSLELDDRGNVVTASSWEAGVVYQATRIVPLRQAVYLADMVIAAAILVYYRLRPRGVVLVDRYFYDSLVDIAAAGRRRWFYSASEAARISTRRLRYMRMVLRCMHKPDLAVFVDVPPPVAFGRKPEYPLEYLEARRVVYHRLFAEFVPHGTIVENLDRQAAIASLIRLATGAREGRRVA